jgi:hypothetical protein
VWVTLTASNSVIVPPWLNARSTPLFLDAALVWSTTTNGLPDWWQMEYFGNLFEPTNGCFDGDGVPDLQKYLAGADPNVITFTISCTNQYVNLTNVPLTLVVQGGVPYNWAVTLDNTNFGAASWTPYTSSNITANLGTNQGWHTVWVGLRGLPANAQQTWNAVCLDLDLAPPTLAITNPAAGSTVSVPVIQVQGFCPEPLSGISYDLLNACGLVTNQQVLVVDQYYDMNIWAFTSNFFQAFDVPLTNGLNTFTFHASDLAGNVTATNFCVTLDYSGKPAPQVQVDWPTDGMMVCGSTFVCCGLVSDPTATVVVEITDTLGDTNIVNATVGRSGDFYALKLPLTNGANYLTLTATDGVGNATTNNLTITQGDSGLNLDTVVAGQTTVTGEIGPGGWDIWVNGVEATNNGYGSWTAEIAPIGLGGRMVVAQAIPDSDQDLVGMRGFAMADSSANSTQWQPNRIPAPSGTYISRYQESDQEQDSWTQTNQIVWQNGQPVSETSFFDAAPGFTELDLCTWPATTWPEPLPAAGALVVTQTYPQFGVSNTWTWNAGPPPLAEEHCNLSFTNPYSGATYLQRTADMQMMLATGGMPGSTNMNLWMISCSATNYLPPWDEYDEPWWWWVPSSTAPINPQNITIKGHALDSNGNLHLVLPDNTNLDVTPVLAGQTNTNSYYTFNVTATNVRVTITPAVLNGTFPLTNCQRIGINAKTITNRAQAFTATVTPSTETNNLHYVNPRAANGGQVLPSLTRSGNLLKTTLGDGVLTFPLVGTNASKNNGEALFVVQHPGFTSQGNSPQLIPVGICSNTVIVPPAVNSPHPLAVTNPIGTNMALSAASVPPFYVRGTNNTGLVTGDFINVTVSVVDRFINASCDLYDGSRITEGGAHINQTLTNSCYHDFVGPMYRAEPPFPYQPFIQSNTQYGINAIAAWAQYNTLLLEPGSFLDARNIEVDGFPLNPAAVGRRLGVSTNPRVLRYGGLSALSKNTYIHHL